MPKPCEECGGTGLEYFSDEHGFITCPYCHGTGKQAEGIARFASGLQLEDEFDTESKD